VQGRRIGDAPRAVRTPGGLRRQVFAHAPFAKFFESRSSALLLFLATALVVELHAVENCFKRRLEAVELLLGRDSHEVNESLGPHHGD